MPSQTKLSVSEIFGFKGQAGKEAFLALKGDKDLPGSQFGLSSLRMFRPKVGPLTWLGQRVLRDRVPIANLYNHTPTPIEEGWSVKLTQVRDFRGKGLTYNSHNGTDFVAPPGTPILASAKGRVVSIRREYNRGGLKVYVDHGRGLMSTYHHLGRALVKLGDRVESGQEIALSGYSGLDALVAFPWVAPHLHYNVILGGQIVDPFARDGEAPLWASGNNHPTARIGDRHSEESSFHPAALQEVLGDLKDEKRRLSLASIADPLFLGWELVIEATTYPTRFRRKGISKILFQDIQRESRLALPFDDSFSGIAFLDEV